MKNILSEEHYILIQNVTDDSREKEFLKKEKQLIERYNSLLNKYSRHNNYKSSLIKPAILNRTKEEIPKHYQSLLNLGPKFVPTNKNLPFMDIITTTESCALDMEHKHKENEVETLRQNVSSILQKKLNLKIRSNLKKKSIKRITKNDQIRVHEFDKGCGFAIVTNDTVKEKIEEQLGKETKARIDPTSRLTNKIQKRLCKLRKENKFTNKTYFELYQFHHVYMAKSKHINRKKLSHASHCIHNRYAALWNIKISCRYHSADTQQKPSQSKKFKIICFASSNMEN